MAAPHWSLSCWLDFDDERDERGGVEGAIAAEQAGVSRDWLADGPPGRTAGKLR